MKSVAKHFLTAIILFSLIATASAATCSSIEQWGITWTFDKPYECGNFANGDWWVVNMAGGDVTITRITPDYRVESGVHINGYEVNPNNMLKQGFDSRLVNFDSSLIKSLPYAAKPNESIVKAVSIWVGAGPLRGQGGSIMTLTDAAVLTVLGTVPQNHSELLRPPYYGLEKPLYNISNLRTQAESLLPSLSSPAGTPSMSAFEQSIKFRGVQLDHYNSYEADYMCPSNNMPNDGGLIANRNNQIAIRLMLNDTFEEKKKLLTDYLQYGVDLYYMGINGRNWIGGGQVGPGRKMPITFAAVMLGNENMKNFVKNADPYRFLENADFWYREKSNMVLWAQSRPIMYGGRDRYWLDLTRVSTSSKTEPDRLGYIDGSNVPGTTYLLSSEAQNAKGVSLALHLMPSLQEVWNDNEIMDFADRWVYQGIWTQPDPCAPPTGVCTANSINPGAACTSANVHYVCWDGNIDNIKNYTFTNGVEVGRIATLCDLTVNWSSGYGVTYGYNDSIPEGCMLDTDPTDGIGRYPWLHGFFKDGGGLRLPAWANQLWDTYRTPNCNWNRRTCGGGCAGTDSSCGIWPTCANCNSRDGCDGNTLRDYYCTGTSCTFTEDNCTDCTCTCGDYNATESIANNNCSDAKDNDCNGKTDIADSGCQTAECTVASDCPAGQTCQNGTCITQQDCVDTTTLLSFIEQWKQGQMTMQALMQKMKQWKAGTGCPAA